MVSVILDVRQYPALRPTQTETFPKILQANIASPSPVSSKFLLLGHHYNLLVTKSNRRVFDTIFFRDFDLSHDSLGFITPTSSAICFEIPKLPNFFLSVNLIRFGLQLGNFVEGLRQ